MKSNTLHLLLIMLVCTHLIPSCSIPVSRVTLTRHLLHQSKEPLANSINGNQGFGAEPPTHQRSRGRTEPLAAGVKEQRPTTVLSLTGQRVETPGATRPGRGEAPPRKMITSEQEMKNRVAEGRKDFQINDYPPTGPNTDHTPKPPHV